MDDMFRPLRKYATFSGRARRKEYWLWFLFYLVGAIVVMYLDTALGLAPEPQTVSEFGDGTAAVGVSFQGGILTWIFIAAMFIPNLAVGIRRLHDTGKSGWWLLIGLVPLIGAIVLIVFFVQSGTPGPNEYGPDPKGANHAEVFA